MTHNSGKGKNNMNNLKAEVILKKYRHFNKTGELVVNDLTQEQVMEIINFYEQSLLTYGEEIREEMINKVEKLSEEENKLPTASTVSEVYIRVLDALLPNPEEETQ